MKRNSSGTSAQMGKSYGLEKLEDASWKNLERALGYGWRETGRFQTGNKTDVAS